MRTECGDNKDGYRILGSYSWASGLVSLTCICVSVVAIEDPQAPIEGGQVGHNRSQS